MSMSGKASTKQMSVHEGTRNSEPKGTMMAPKGKNVGADAYRTGVAMNPKPLGGRNA